MFSTKLIYSVGLILMLVSGVIFGVEGISQYEVVLLGISMLLICLSNGKLYFYSNNRNILTSLFIYFIASIAISLVAHLELSILIAVLGLILLTFTLLFHAPILRLKNAISYEDDANLIMKVLILIQILSVLQGFTTYRFKGIYKNPNFAGGEAATLCAISCSLFLQRFISSKNKSLLLPLLSIIFSTIIVISTNSRNSVGVIGIILLFFVFLTLRNLNDRNNFLKILAILFIIIVIVNFSPISDIFKSSISELYEKINRRTGDELGGRQEIWKVVFDRMKFFGNGEKNEISAHNTFLSMLDQYGIIPCFLLTLFVIVGVIKSILLALDKNYHDMKFMPLFFFLCFGISCMFEQMLLKNSMLLCLYSVPILYKKSDLKVDIKLNNRKQG